MNRVRGCGDLSTFSIVGGGLGVKQFLRVEGAGRQQRQYTVFSIQGKTERQGREDRVSGVGCREKMKDKKNDKKTDID